MLPQILQNPGALLVLAFVMVLGVGQLTLQRETTAAKKDDLFVSFAADVRRDFATLREEHTVLTNKHSQLEREFRLLVGERNQLQNDLQTARIQINKLETEKTAMQVEIDTLKARVKELEAQVGHNASSG